MKKILGLALILAAPLAHADYSSADMTCKEVHSLIRAKGAAIIWTSDSTFDRYVKTYSNCASGEELKQDWIMTSDRDECLVYRCVPREDQG